MKGIFYRKLTLKTVLLKQQQQKKDNENVQISCVVAAPVDDDVHAEVKELKSDVRADGFDFTLDTSNNIHEQASGDAHGNVHGDFEWVSPEGVHVKVSYVADEQGYHPSSDLLPTPPPVPVAILKALEFINAHPQKEEAKH
uniref:Larval cuticle protein 2 n=1 Tax=Glossina palpalis gambiensis TaxID=67801 RepID=A0A1B0B4I9_9MUSC